MVAFVPGPQSFQLIVDANTFHQPEERPGPKWSIRHGDVFYLQALSVHFNTGSSIDLCTVNGVKYPTHQEVAWTMGRQPRCKHYGFRDPGLLILLSSVGGEFSYCKGAIWTLIRGFCSCVAFKWGVLRVLRNSHSHSK
jgi:hypothetical protein